MRLLFNDLLLNVIYHFLRDYDNSHNYRRSPRNSRIQAFDGKIDGSCVPGPRSGPPHSVPTILPTSKRSRERDPLSESQSRLHAPYRG
jgi:hypothetical protein